MSTHYNPNPPENIPSGRRSEAKPTTSAWQKFRQTKFFPFICVGVACALFGGVVGASGQPDPVEVVKEVPGPERVVTNTVEKKVEVPVTPPSCIKYIGLSEQGFSYAAEAMGYMSDALTAAGSLNTAALSAASDKIAVVSPKMKALAPETNAAKAECRASAK